MTFSDVFQNSIVVFFFTYMGTYFYLIWLALKTNTYIYNYWAEFESVLFEGWPLRIILAFVASLGYIFWMYHP